MTIDPKEIARFFEILETPEFTLADICRASTEAQSRIRVLYGDDEMMKVYVTTFLSCLPKPKKEKTNVGS